MLIRSNGLRPSPILGCLAHHSSQFYLALKPKGERILTLRVFLILLVTKILFKNAKYCVSFITEFILSALKNYLCGRIQCCFNFSIISKPIIFMSFAMLKPRQKLMTVEKKFSSLLHFKCL